VSLSTGRRSQADAGSDDARAKAFIDIAKGLNRDSQGSRDNGVMIRKVRIRNYRKDL
jgi:hypothetical protein